MTIGNIFRVALLLINAVAVLNEERFLARVGWSPAAIQQQQIHSFGDAGPYGAGPAGGGGVGNPYDPNNASVKVRLVNLISAIRTLMRIPLIIVNVLVIVYELIFG